MFCSKCGSRVDDGDMFCWNCGNKMPVVEKKQETVSNTGGYSSAGTGTYTGGNQMYNGYGAAPVYEEAPVSRHMTIAEADRAYDISTLPTKKETGIRSVYMIDFVVRLFSKSNIPLLIYLFLNVVLIGLVVTAVCQLPVYWGILCGLILYVASISIALSSIGEAILRHQNGCHKIEEQDIIERLYPIFKEVYYKAKKANPMISDDVRLFINDDKSPNAFATGRKTMCVTRGLLQLSDEEIKATLGHEFGHLSHKDTDRILVVGVGNTVITGIAVMIQISAIFTEICGHIVSIFTDDDNGWLIRLFSTLSKIITLFIINVFMKIWNMIGIALCMKTSRNNEYEADEFSARLGYSEGLISLLAFVGDEKPKGLFASLASSHPASADRIAHIKNVQAQLEAAE